MVENQPVTSSQAGPIARGNLQGRAQLSRFTPDDLRGAVDSFDAALRLDRNYAPAYGGLAMASAAIRLRGARDSETRAWGERAEQAGRTALRLGRLELLLIRREILDTRSQYLDALLEAAPARIDLDASAAILR